MSGTDADALEQLGRRMEAAGDQGRRVTRAEVVAHLVAMFGTPAGV